ncbi:unnamed protein product [Ranitomeya imitator]|uniref:Uncharacterized protein n=1 Tax=Ranitomeya imitator TaxID=111125 RepID=A0ABN9LF10_9NEOB|nr:unnamed protein product [Ranitomeya imitator]
MKKKSEDEGIELAISLILREFFAMRRHVELPDRTTKMATTFTGPKVYQDNFDPQIYLDTYYGALTGVFIKDGYLEFILKKLHKAFTSVVTYLVFY